jgi:hypothetical protein
LVWLPSQLSKLSDREGGFVQVFLQALSIKIFRGLPLEQELSDVVEPIWGRLPAPSEAMEASLPDLADINYFAFSEKWVARRVTTLTTVVRALGDVSQGRRITQKIVSSRYGEGLARVAPAECAALETELSSYLRAVSV